MEVSGIATALLSYLLGCFSTGYYLVRLRTGQDIRKLGSGSAGGRNVSRILGPSGLILTGIGDILKGFLAVWLAIQLDAAQWAVLASALAVVIGHIWPVQLGFRGGKGLATAFGALILVDYRFVLIWIGVALISLALTRRSTLSGIVALGVTPFASLLLQPGTGPLIMIFALSGIMLVAFRDNLRSILSRSSGPIADG